MYSLSPAIAFIFKYMVAEAKIYIGRHNCGYREEDAHRKQAFTKDTFFSIKGRNISKLSHL